MRKMLRTLIVFASIACLVLTFALSGCTKHPNEEQLNTLEETQKAALAAEDELAQKQQEKASSQSRCLLGGRCLITLCSDHHIVFQE